MGHEVKIGRTKREHKGGEDGSGRIGSLLIAESGGRTSATAIIIILIV